MNMQTMRVFGAMDIAAVILLIRWVANQSLLLYLVMPKGTQNTQNPKK